MKKFLPHLVIVVISALVSVIWFSRGVIMGGGESGLPFYDLQVMYENSRFAWSDFVLGNPRLL